MLKNKIENIKPGTILIVRYVQDPVKFLDYHQKLYGLAVVERVDGIKANVYISNTRVANDKEIAQFIAKMILR